MSERATWRRAAAVGPFLPGVFVLGVGIAVFCGWLVDSETLKSVSPRFSQMKANSAVALASAGASLIFLRCGWTRIGRGLAALVALIGALTLVEHAFGVRLGIDELLFADASSGPGTPSPGQMGPNTAFCLTVAGLSLLLLDREWRRVRPAHVGAAVIALVAFVAVLGYVYGVPRLKLGFVTRNVIPMALHTAIALLVLALGLVLGRGAVGVLALLRSPGAGGVLLRRLGPAAVLLPVLVGYARLEGQRHGLFGTEEGIALFATSLAVVFSVLVIVTAHILDRVDAERLASESRERGVVDVALDCIVVIDEDGLVLDFNPAAERTFGYQRYEAIGRELAELIVPASVREAHRRALARCVATGESSLLGRRLEMSAMRVDGTEFPVELSISQLQRPDRVTFVGHLRDLTDQVASQRSVSLLAAVVESSRDAIVAVDLDGTVVVWNDAAERVYGYSAAEMIGQSAFGILTTDEVEAEGRELWARVQRGESVEREGSRVRRDGERIQLAFTLFPILGADGRMVAVGAIVRDLTERQRLEDQLRQSQKMEAIGQLAGGIAHDFNNLLTVIGGFAAIGQRRVGVGPGANELTEIEHAAARAARLTDQLLAFSRHQVLEPVTLDLNDVVSGLTPMLGRLIGEEIEVGIIADPLLPTIVADRGQIEQVVVNLAVNARDAMAGGGTLTISTSAERLDKRDAAEHPGVQPGRYACLDITDTGTGIEPEALEHVFEPFFTTKDVGEGTGLGLSTVHGIVSQSGGHVRVSSERGLGTSFRLYFPAAAAEADEPAPIEPPTEELEGSETILLCEDDDALRRYLETLLTDHGYTVVPFAKALDAVELARAGERPFDILITDIVMPGMRGTDLAEHLRRIKPGLQVIFLSGYAHDHLTRQELPPASAFLEKPFEPDALLAAIRRRFASSALRESNDS